MLLVDEADRVLLIEGFDPAATELGTWWITPGGGREASEDARAGRDPGGVGGDRALLDGVTGPLWHRTTVFPFDGDVVEQTEDFFCARTPHFEPAGAALTDLEHRSTVRMRWWSLAEIESTEAQVFPETLADLLRDALAGCPRAESV